MIVKKYDKAQYLRFFNLMLDKEPLHVKDDVVVITDLWHDDEKTYIEYKRMYPVWLMKSLRRLTEHCNTSS